MNLRLPIFLLTLLLPAAAGQNADNTPAIREASAPAFNFNLIPKPFQRNPQLEMTVYTVMTDFGRTLPVAEPATPVTYVASDHGFMPLGDAVGRQRPPLPAEVEKIMVRALNERGYVAAPDGQAPGLVLIYYWGSHYRLDLDMQRMFPEMHRQHLLERATLVGGPAYAQEILRQFEWGYLPGDRSLKKGYLFQQADTDLYFVVISAYDHASVLARAPKLAWRTTMTVNAIGVAMKESLPPLILTAAEWFGREMDDTVALRRSVHRGTVELGPLRVIEDDEPPPPPAEGKGR